MALPQSYGTSEETPVNGCLSWNELDQFCYENHDHIPKDTTAPQRFICSEDGQALTASIAEFPVLDVRAMSSNLSPYDESCLSTPRYMIEKHANLRIDTTPKYTGALELPRAPPGNSRDNFELSGKTSSDLLIFSTPRSTGYNSPEWLDSPMASSASSTTSICSTRSSPSVPDEVGSRLEPLLHASIRSRNQRMLAMLLEHRAVDEVDETDSRGRSALHLASELGDKALVMILLQHGAYPRLCDNEGRSPLYIAVSRGHDVIVESMLKLGVTLRR